MNAYSAFQNSVNPQNIQRYASSMYCLFFSRTATYGGLEYLVLYYIEVVWTDRTLIAPLAPFFEEKSQVI